MTAHVVQTGVVCAIGMGAQQCSASFRAGLSGYVQTSVMGRGSEPLVMALVPEQHLDPLHAELEPRALGDRERRMLRLGGMAFDELRASGSASFDRRLPIFLALPEPHPGQTAHSDRGFIDHLGLQTGMTFDSDRSQYFEVGRSGGLFALQAAMAAMSGGCEEVLVGGIESCLDLTWIARLDAERRLLRADVKDGFVPGEAAAFLLLSRSRASAAAGLTQILAVGTAEDPGHRYSDAPALGQGLAAALESACAVAGDFPAIKTCFAGLNGENFGAKEWGVAHIRHHARFDIAHAFEHPADCFGDIGAAMGPTLLALADETLRSHQRQGPMLVWASSDRAPVACVLVSTSE